MLIGLRSRLEAGAFFYPLKKGVIMNNKRDFFLSKIDNLKDCLAYLQKNKSFYEANFFNLYYMKIVKEIKELESYIETL